MFAGSTESTQKIFIRTPDAHGLNPSKSNASVVEKSVEDSKSAANAEVDKIFESRNSYIHLSVTLSEPINPVINSQSLPSATEIGRKAASSNIPVFPNVKDAVCDY